jgi:hypothetical protein
MYIHSVFFLLNVFLQHVSKADFSFNISMYFIYSIENYKYFYLKIPYIGIVHIIIFNVFTQINQYLRKKKEKSPAAEVTA